MGKTCSFIDESNVQIPVSWSKLDLSLDGDIEDLVGEVWSLLGVSVLFVLLAEGVVGLGLIMLLRSMLVIVLSALSLERSPLEMDARNEPYCTLESGVSI